MGTKDSGLPLHAAFCDETVSLDVRRQASVDGCLTIVCLTTLFDRLCLWLKSHCDVCCVDWLAYACVLAYVQNPRSERTVAPATVLVCMLAGQWTPAWATVAATVLHQLRTTLRQRPTSANCSCDASETLPLRMPSSSSTSSLSFCYTEADEHDIESVVGDCNETGTNGSCDPSWQWQWHGVEDTHCRDVRPLQPTHSGDHGAHGTTAQPNANLHAKTVPGLDIV